MPKLDDQISTLQERLKQLKLRQQRSDARKRALDAQRERKAETRRKFLVGAVILELAAKGGLDRGQLTAWLDAALSRREDRILFDLPVSGPSGEPQLPPGVEHDEGDGVR